MTPGRVVTPAERVRRKNVIPKTTADPSFSSVGVIEGQNATPETIGKGPIPKRVCIFVEPSPFTYVCGYMNRFCNLIRYLREAGCEVLVITTGVFARLRCSPALNRVVRCDRPS